MREKGQSIQKAVGRTLVYYESFETKEEAMRREYEIKHMPREKKEKIIERGRLQV